MVDAREQNVYLAKLAEQAERYDEMAEHMKVGIQRRALFGDLGITEVAERSFADLALRK